MNTSMALDMRSLYMMLLIVHFSFAFFQVSMWTIRRSPGMLLWGLSNMTTGIGSVLLILRDIAPDWLSIVVGNGFFLNSWALMWCGQRQFNGHHHSTAWYWLPSLAIMLLFQFAPLFEHDTRARICFTHGILVVLSLASFWDMRNAQRGEWLSARRVLMGIYLFSIAMSSLRIVLTLLGPEIVSYMEPSTVQSSMQTLGLITSVSWNLLLLLMTHERQEKQLTQAAQVDGLTQALNRVGFDQLSQRQLERSRRDGQPVSVLLLDLDNFKQVNDQHGHDAGDAFLCGIASALTAALRGGDVLARMGGDEFVVVGLGPKLSGDGAEAAKLLERRLALATMGHYPVGMTVIDYAGASVGVACLDPQHISVEDALRESDAAMYRIKLTRRQSSQR